MSSGVVRIPRAAGPPPAASQGSWDEGDLLGSAWMALSASHGACLPGDEVESM